MSCEKDDSTVIDPVLNIPTISNPTLDPSLFNSDSVKSLATVQVSSVDPIGIVTVTVSDPNGQLRSFELKDDGVAPDIIANDGKYSGYIDFVMTCRLVGDYKAEFVASTQKGLNSSVIDLTFHDENTNNHPPVISNIVAFPDSAQFNQPVNIGFMVTALDPDGQCDIRRVFYTAVAPDGANLTEQDLFDDGSCCPIGNFPPSGDTTANDNKYTRIFLNVIPNVHGVGNYVYSLHAIDRTGDSSNVLTHTIRVY
jgi:hypothetical protein